MKTSLKACFAPIFSCCPKNLSCSKCGGRGGRGAAAPLVPTARTPMKSNNGKIKESFFLILSAYIHDSEQKKIKNL